MAFIQRPTLAAFGCKLNVLGRRSRVLAPSHDREFAKVEKDLIEGLRDPDRFEVARVSRDEVGRPIAAAQL